MSGGDSVDLWQVYPDDLIPASEAAALAGVAEATIRQWATRKKISRFPGRRRAEPTLYARPEILAEIAKRAEHQVLAA
jgi:hypothetical protein